MLITQPSNPKAQTGNCNYSKVTTWQAEEFLLVASLLLNQPWSCDILQILTFKGFRQAQSAVAPDWLGHAGYSVKHLDCLQFAPCMANTAVLSI
jgi:hypothetical protein